MKGFNAITSCRDHSLDQVISALCHRQLHTALAQPHARRSGHRLRIVMQLYAVQQRCHLPIIYRMPRLDLIDLWST